MLEALSFAKILGWGKSLFASKAFWITMIVAACIGGTAMLVHHDVKTHVAAAVTAADTKATVQAYETKDVAVKAAAKVDQKYDALATKTAKDYDNVRINPPSVSSASSPADLLIVDTLNQLAGLHGAQPSNGFSDSSD